MSNQHQPINSAHNPLLYQIRLKGQLGSLWTNWFGGLAITLDENGDTLITGPVADQAALHGLLRKIRDLGIPLISLVLLEPGPADRSQSKQSEASH